MNKLILSIFIIFSFFIIEMVFAQKEETQGKNSTIVEVDGYAFLAGDKTINELRVEALQNAKRNALEMSETHIRSYTKIENFKLCYDVIVSEADGKVQIIEQKDHGITTDQRYHVWIKAEVIFAFKNSGEIGRPDLIDESMYPLQVVLTTDRKDYVNGDHIKISMIGNKDFYARLVYKTNSGDLLQLFPNQHRHDSLIKGRQIVNIPDDTDLFVFEAIGPPFGKEKIILYASTTDLGKVNLDTYGNHFFKIQEDVESVSKLTRGIKIVEELENDPFKGEEFFQAEYDITVRSK